MHNINNIIKGYNRDEKMLNVLLRIIMHIKINIFDKQF